MRIVLAAMAIAGAALAWMPAAAATTVGNANSGNCIPFGCSGSLHIEWYQAIYAGTAFPAGPTNIDTISFARSGNNALDSASYDLKFYTTTLDPSAITADRIGNRGTLLSNFGTFSAGPSNLGTLTFTGTPFVYDPSAGNLLLDVGVSNAVDGGGYGGFDTDSDQTTVGRAVSDGSISYAGSDALVTTFSGAPGAPGPLAGLGLLPALAGIGSLVVTRTRRRKAVLA